MWICLGILFFLAILLIMKACYNDGQTNAYNESLRQFEFINSYIHTKFEVQKNMNQVLNLKIVCDNPKYMPAYANNTDACMDLKIKIDSKEEQNSEKCYFLAPGETHSFGTGIKCSVPENHIMMIFPRSSTGFKLNCRLANSTGIIDAGYRDEIKMAITNFGKETVCLQDGQRLAQFVILPRPQIELFEVKDDENFRNGDRGGGIGSSGKY